MAKRKMKESMDNITNIKDSTAALSPEMQLAKERAKDKDEEFEKIVLSKDGVLGASKQPTPDKPKWSLDESLFDKPISLVEMWDQDDDELDIDSVLDLVYDGSIDSIMVVDFLSDHETAFEDACKAFGVSSDDFDEQCEALNQEDPEDLVNWVSDHELLWSDFCNYVSNQLDQFNESLKRKELREGAEEDKAYERYYKVALKLCNKYGYGEDQFTEEITEQVLEDNGPNLTNKEVKEIMLDYFEGEDDSDDTSAEESFCFVIYYNNNGDAKVRFVNGATVKDVENKVKKLADKYKIKEISWASSGVEGSEYLSSFGIGRTDFSDIPFDESLKEDIELYGDEDVWKLIQIGFLDSEWIGDFLSEHTKEWDELCKDFDIASENSNEEWKSFIHLDANDIAKWIEKRPKLWKKFERFVSKLRKQAMGESLNESSDSQELRARQDVANYFYSILENEYVTDPLQASQLDAQVDSYNIDWCPEEFDDPAQKKMEKVEDLIDQLSIAIADTYFNDSFNESFKGKKLSESWTDAYQQFGEIADNLAGSSPDWEDEVWDEVEALYKSHKGEPDWDEAYRRWTEDVYHITYVVGSDKNEAEDELASLKKEYQGWNVNFKLIQIDNGVWGIDFIGSYEDLAEVVEDFKPLGEFVSEDDLKPLEESRQPIKSNRGNTMKRYMIEEMKEDNQITDVDAYNESRDAKLVKRYKSILGLDEDFEITEENLDDWALKHACTLEGANYDRAKAAVLGLKFEGYK